MASLADSLSCFHSSKMLSLPKLWPILISILFLFFAVPPNTRNVIAEPSFLAHSPPIPPFSLPTAYPSSLTAQNPALELQIRSILSHYPLAIDGKNFPALSLIFTQEVVANYSAPLGVLTGLASMISALETNLAPVNTQHALSTQIIGILDGETEASTLTYFTATHFGMGTYYGEVSRFKICSFVCLNFCCVLWLRPSAA